jgi:hypothetical protein
MMEISEGMLKEIDRQQDIRRTVSIGHERRQDISLGDAIWKNP